MTCNHCVARVKQVLESEAGITGVTVDLASKRATFEASDDAWANLYATMVRLRNEGYSSARTNGPMPPPPKLGRPEDYANEG